jgi:uncharacterized protein YbaR (Trm112 family)
MGTSGIILPPDIARERSDSTGLSLGDPPLHSDAIVPVFAPPLQRRPLMPVDAQLLDILACPSCKTLVKNDTALKCGQCHRVYPIKDDIPIMLIDEASIEED